LGKKASTKNHCFDTDSDKHSPNNGCLVVVMPYVARALKLGKVFIQKAELQLL